MPLDNDYIGTLAEHAVSSECIKFPRLSSTGIHRGGNYPIWDGEIFAYSDSQRANEHLLGRIPIQIKGRCVEDFSSSNTQFDVLVSALKNYEGEGGVVFFVVEIRETDRAAVIYYALLHSFDILNHLRDIPEAQKHKRIRFTRLPQKDQNNIETVCWFFLKLRRIPARRTAITNEEIADIAASKEVSILVPPGTVRQPEDIIRLEQVYFSTEIGMGISAIYDSRPVDAISTIIDKPIIVDDEIFYTQYRRTLTNRDETIFELGDCVKLVFHNDEVTLQHKTNTTMQKTIHDLKFIVKLYHSDNVQLGYSERTTFIKREERAAILQKDEFVRMQALYELLKDSYEMLVYLGVSEALNVAVPTKERMDILRELLIYHRHGANSKINLSEFFYRLELDDGIVFFVVAHGKIHGLFAQEMLRYKHSADIHYLENPDVTIRTVSITPYIKLKPEDYAKCINCSCDVIWESIQLYAIDEDTFELLNQMLLNIITTYDITNRQDFLSLAENLANHLILYSSGEMAKVNLLQVKYRQHSLGGEDVEWLKQVANGNNKAFSCAALLLLNDRERFVDIYALMDEEEQSSFSNYPIATIHKEWFCRRAQIVRE